MKKSFTEASPCLVEGLLQMLQLVPLGEEKRHLVLEVLTKGLPGCHQCTRQELFRYKQALPSDNCEAPVPVDQANPCDLSRS